MSRPIRTIAALAVAAATLPLSGTAAHADNTGDTWSASITSNSDPARGHVCAFENTADITAEAGTTFGQIRAGLVVLTGGIGATLTCQIQVDQSTPNGSGPALTVHGVGVILPSAAVENFVTGQTNPVYLCALLTDDLTGTTRYWDADHSTWSTSATVHCQLATHVSAH
jgi:hypothetical protein